MERSDRIDSLKFVIHSLDAAAGKAGSKDG